MSKVSFCILWLLIVATKSLCQGDYFPPEVIPRGDSSSAIRARHHEYTDNTLIAQLGYIDTNSATEKEIRDNLEIGLLAVPGNNYEIVSFTMWYSAHNRDVNGYFVSGNKVPLAALKELFMNHLKAGESISFTEIRAMRHNSALTIPLKSITIKIID